VGHQYRDRQQLTEVQGNENFQHSKESAQTKKDGMLFSQAHLNG
jgi:hypothetical protein